MDPELGIHHSQRVISHLAGADRVIGRHSHGTDKVGYRGVSLNFCSRVDLHTAVGSEGLHVCYFAAQADPLDQRLPVGLARKIAGLNGRRLQRVRRTQGDEPSTLGTQWGEPDREAVAFQAHKPVLDSIHGHEGDLDVRRRQLSPRL